MINNHTFKEIFRQPESWKKEYNILLEQRNKIREYISNNKVSKHSEIIFTGAGTSAFIGNILEVIFAKKGFTSCKSIATTDILSHPEAYLPVGRDLVLISFARSGNSPESVSTVKLANSLCSKVNNIVITCNENGELAKNINSDDLLLLLLPSETNDKGLAMTNSFSTMLLTGTLLADMNQIEDIENIITNLSNIAKSLLDNYAPQLQNIAQRNFSRAVFLGSGELKGVAEECHLKLQELTDGAVICKHDSYLGFRHGPKAMINNETLIVYLLSNDDYVLQYEKDLIEQINSNNKLVGQIAVSQRKIDIPNVNLDLEVVIGENAFAFISYAIVGQLIGYYKSLSMGLNPDSPAVSGNIARVVEGVNIYEYPAIQKISK